VSSYSTEGLVPWFIWFIWQGFVVEGVGSKGGFCEKTLEAAPLLEPVPAGSKMDPLLAKAEPISDIGSTSVTIYLRNSENRCAAAVTKKSEKM